MTPPGAGACRRVRPGILVAVAHVIEPASSGRAKCRGCGNAIAKGELRLGERLPNPYADEGEMTLWFHLLCGAYKRPEALADALEATPEGVEERDRLAEIAARGVAHRRLPRIDGAQLSPTGRAKCRHCREPIPAKTWRIRLTFFEEARFEPSGFVHVGCVEDYFETRDVLDRVKHFSPDLAPDELVELEHVLGDPAG